MFVLYGRSLSCSFAHLLIYLLTRRQRWDLRLGNLYSELGRSILAQSPETSEPSSLATTDCDDAASCLWVAGRFMGYAALGRHVPSSLSQPADCVASAPPSFTVWDVL